MVYLAEQVEPVQRRVALKLIKPGMDSQAVIARFQAERQALALMDHPHVARVFEAGATDDGRPYFVMEFVAGIPITEHCERRQLGINERLDLFIQVCEAVQHAHHKGIIHRDIKPSNVLVAVDEGAAAVKVIDFGIAKALHHKLNEEVLSTAVGQLVGTPEYMSPEQAEMGGRDIDTRSDVYALGVLLYRLLTGTLPFDSTSLRQGGLGEIRRIICEQEPPRPSTRLSRLGDDPGGASTPARLDTPDLSRQVRGDLDWIAMKALEKDRERRYQTAADLARDIERHLRDDPVLAGPPSATYRVGKFVRRHRGAVLAAGAILTALVLAVAGTTWGWLQAIDARDAEATARAEATREKQIAEAVTDFLTDDLLAAVAPSAASGKGRDVLMHEVLDEAGLRIEQAAAPGGRFSDLPLVEAAIRQVLGFTYRLLGESGPAEHHLLRAAELRQRILGADDPDTLVSTNSLATLYENIGRYEEAERLYRATYEARRRVLGEEHPETLGSANNVALMHLQQGRFDEAESLLLSTLAGMERELPEGHAALLLPVGNLARLYRMQGRLDESEPLHQQLLEITVSHHGTEHPSTLAARNNLGNLYRDQGRYDEAQAIHVETLALRERVLGPEHPDTLMSMMNVATYACAQQRYEDAEALQAQAVASSTTAWPEGAWFVGAFRRDHGRTLTWLGRFDEAEATLEVAHRILSSSVGPEHVQADLLARAFEDLYVAWNAAEPGLGYDVKAEAWGARTHASPR